MAESRPRLLTIPISHYCEKARWALERAGIDYVEEAHLQMIHRLHALRSRGGRRVPVLITDEGVISESSEIVRWIDRQLPASRRLVPAELRTEIDRIEARLDEGLGVEGRRWMYSVVIGTEIPRRFGLGPLPRWERAAVPALLPVLGVYLRAFMAVGPDQAAAALAEVDRAFDWIEEMLADGRPYLVGDRFTAADLAFAALSAAVLMPERYGVALPQPEDLPPDVAREVVRLRRRPAGVFASRIVETERPWPPASGGRQAAGPR